MAADDSGRPGDGGPTGQQPAMQGLTPEVLGRIAFGFVIAIAGSLVFVHFKLPLPWFLGALTFCLIASVLGAPIERPKVLQVPVRIALGVTIGAAFTPALLSKFGGMVVSLLLIVPFSVTITIVGTLYFERFARFDRPTAFFCAVPGGLTDMVTMAADAGASARTVTLVQATRIVLIVFLLPFWLQWVEGRAIGGAVPQLPRLSALPLADAAVLVVIGVAGWRIARALGIAGAPMIGPMVLSGLAHAFGLTGAKVPLEVVIAVQVTLGFLLGAQFRGISWAEFSNSMVWGVVFAVLLTIVSGFVVLLVARITGFDSTTLLLAYAPGGQSELNLVAFVLGLDVAFTALHHLVRLAVVIMGAQLVFAVRKDWRKSDD